DEREQAVAQAWCKVLRRQTVGIRQNYFELGGDSITAIQIVGDLKREGWELRVRDIFQHPTVEGLACRLQHGTRPAATAPLRASVPLAPIQRWFFDCHSGPLHHFNQSVLLKCRQTMDP